MDPITIISMIAAAFSAGGPILKIAVDEAAIIGADVAAKKSAIQTFEDALAGLQAEFSNNPLPAPAKAA
jgi:hypothetical protein